MDSKRKMLTASGMSIAVRQTEHRISNAECQGPEL